MPKSELLKTAMMVNKFIEWTTGSKSNCAVLDTRKTGL